MEQKKSILTLLRVPGIIISKRTKRQLAEGQHHDVSSGGQRL